LRKIKRMDNIIIDEGDRCPNCNGYDITRTIPYGPDAPARICNTCNAEWIPKLKIHCLDDINEIEIVENKWIYFVQICDLEACWYIGLWDSFEQAKQYFENYALNIDMFELDKTLGKRRLNSTRAAIILEKIHAI